jgi:hypothetical protein
MPTFVPLEDRMGAYKDEESWERFVKEMAAQGLDVNNYEQMASYAAAIFAKPQRKQRAAAEGRKRSMSRDHS